MSFAAPSRPSALIVRPRQSRGDKHLSEVAAVRHDDIGIDPARILVDLHVLKHDDLADELRGERLGLLRQLLLRGALALDLRRIGIAQPNAVLSGQDIAVDRSGIAVVAGDDADLDGLAIAVSALSADTVATTGEDSGMQRPRMVIFTRSFSIGFAHL
jgi:hypothetical protein